jgi:hypothetical protein
LATTTTTIIESNNKDNFDDDRRKLELATADLQQPFYSNVLCEFLPQNCSSVIVDYLLAMKAEKNLSAHYSQVIIKLSKKLSIFVKFKDWKALL